MAAAWIENLKTRRTAITTELAALTSAGAGGKPTASGDGVNVDHVGYKDGLYRELKSIDEMLEKAGAGAASEQDVGIEETEEYV
jgi:hypothetical protein